MALNANNVPSGGGGSQDPLEAGTYPARTVQIIDLGLQNQRPFQGQEKPPAQEVLVTYEFVDVFMKDEEGNELEDKPLWRSETFPLHNLRADKAKSTKRYNALDPTGTHAGDFSKLLDIPCNVTIVLNPGKGQHAGKVFENVANVAPMRLRDAQKCPPLVNEPIFFDLDNPDLEVYARLAPWIQKKIRDNLNFNGSKLQHMLGAVTQGATEIDVADEASVEDENPF